jgi:hypothetical protein
MYSRYDILLELRHKLTGSEIVEAEEGKEAELGISTNQQTADEPIYRFFYLNSRRRDITKYNCTIDNKPETLRPC